MKYVVGVREVHVASIEVEADSPEEAIKKVDDLGIDAGEELLVEFSHRLPIDTWSVHDNAGRELVISTCN